MFIYKILNKLDNKVYIGQTTSKYASSRWQIHKYDAKNKRKDHPLHRAINKYGINNFIFEVIYTAFDQVELNLREIEFIKLYNCIAPFGYNLLAGGKNAKHTEETKKKIGLKSLGRKTFLGKKHSKETKELISKNRKGKKESEEISESKAKTYYFLNSNDQLIKIKNLRRFCRENNYIRSSLTKVNKGTMKEHRGLRKY